MARNINTNSVVISPEDLLSEVLVMEKALRELKKKLLSALPPKYGSEEWWEKMDSEAEESIRNGEGKKFTTYEEAIHYLHS